MKVAQVSFWDIKFGAARAAYRVNHAMRRHGIDSQMYVSEASSGDWTVHTPAGKWRSQIGQFRRPLAGLLAKQLHTKNRALHSPAIIPSRWPYWLNTLDVDVINLHWVAAEMMSIADIGKLLVPVVWTLHDMWGFCGAEHVTEDFRWRDGYTRQNRPAYESGFDLNRWTWQRKMKHWRRPLHIIAPSRWLADCVRQSALMRDWQVSVAPEPVDTETFRPTDKTLARKLLRLPTDVPLLLFGAIGGTFDPNKGFDLLKSALDHLRGQIPGLELVIFGQLAPKVPMNLGFPIHYAGHLSDDISLSLLYSAADAVVMPSRREAFGYVGAEAHACGTPAVAFDVSGLLDVVEHEKTGYLAKHFDTEDLARGIQWVLADAERRSMLGKNARQAAVERFSFPVAAMLYLQAYEAALRVQGRS